MRTSCRLRQKMLGLTLVELLVAVTISVIVFSMGVTIYVAIKNQFIDFKDKSLVEVKELRTKKVIYDFVKNAGFACKFGYTEQSPYIDKTGDSLESYFLGSGSSVRVGPLPFEVSANLTGALEDGCYGECYQAETNYLLVRKEEKHTNLTANNNLNISLSLVDTDALGSKDYLLLCNKDYINLVKIASLNKIDDIVTLVHSPSDTTYYAGDYAGKYELHILYIRNTGHKDARDNDIYSLYVYVKEGASRGISYELVRGVEDLQVKYATVNDNSLIWHPVTTDLELDSNYRAIKVSFTIDNKAFSKIVLL